MGDSSEGNTGADIASAFPPVPGVTWNSERAKSPSGVGAPAEEGRTPANQKARSSRASRRRRG